MNHLFRTLLFLIIVGNYYVYSQEYTLSGYVLNSNNEPIPYTNIYIKDKKIGVAGDVNGKYSIMLENGVYDVIFSVIGYQTTELKVTINSTDVQKNVWLQTSEINLEEVTIKARSRDPAYEIIKKTIENKEKYIEPYESIKSNIYIKAMKDKNQEESSNSSGFFKLPDIRKKKKDTVNFETAAEEKMDWIEIAAERYFEYPDKIKEIRKGYKETGDKQGFYYLTTSEADFNFYKNLIYAPSLSDMPLISPLNRMSVLSYKFEFISTFSESGYMIHKIKVKPRNSQSSCFEGYVYIIDELWALYKVDLEVLGYTLNFYDFFTLKQEYFNYQDSIWLINKQVMGYGNEGKNARTAYTKVVYSDFELNPELNKNFFNNALLITTAESIEKDSIFWNEERPEPLTPTEQKLLAYKDSVYEAHQSEAYLDSIDAMNNKLKISDIWNGYTNYNRDKEQTLIYPSILYTLAPFSLLMPGGYRTYTSIGYAREFENKRKIFIWPTINYGYMNNDWNGDFYMQYLINPIKHSRISLEFGNRFDMIINNFDINIQGLGSGNYYEKSFGYLQYRTEIFNGFFASATTELSYNYDITGLDNFMWYDSIFINNEPIKFEPFYQWETKFKIEYTPFQKYYLEPYKKVILGSKYPTLSLAFNRGWGNLISNTNTYNFIEFQIQQEIRTATMGITRYSLVLGDFLGNPKTAFINRKYYIMSDLVYFSNPMYTYSLLDSSITTTNFFFEAHYIHNFGGVLFNKLPIFKMLKLKSSVGSNFLYTIDGNNKHIEMFVGVEKEFRVFNERFKIGLFPIANMNNQGDLFNYRIKIGINWYDQRKSSWMY